MTNKEIIDEAKTIAIHMTDEESAWRSSNARKTTFCRDSNNNIVSVRVLFGQAFRGEI
jgi:hypothetical protein